MLPLSAGKGQFVSYKRQSLTKWLLPALLLNLLVACTGVSQPESKTTISSVRPEDPLNLQTRENRPGLAALDIARSLLGVPYRYGGNDLRGFDCSGLVQYTFSRTGVKLPRSSREIFRSSQLIDPNDLQPGDLVFFFISSNKVSHVGIYEGQNRFIHAPSSGKGVSYAQLDNPYWRERLAGAGRF